MLYSDRWMQYRKFGQTDLEVSTICFGPMRFAAKSPGADEKSEAGQRALERALERGVNFIHSSYEYGTRWAMSEVLRRHPKRHELHHIIKVPVPDFEDGDRFDAGKFRHRVEEALRDLHTDRIAVIQHLQRSKPNSDEQRIPGIDAVHDEMREIFEKLKEEGKVGHLTTFPYTPGFARRALETGDFSGLVAYYNLIEMEMSEFFADMEERGEGFFCIRPFMAGLLTSERAERNSLSDGDRFNDSKWDTAYERLGLIASKFSGEIDSWTAFSIRVALAHPIVASLVVGLNSVEQVDSVIDAAEAAQVDHALYSRVLEIFQEH